MRITLLGHHDIASLYALDRILCGAPQHDYSIFLSGPLRESGDVPPELLQLEATDRELCRAFLRGARASPRLATAAELPSPNSPGGLSELRSTRPDLVVSIRYRRILKAAAIAIPRHGVLNLHSAILPDYRGVMATFWAMLAGEHDIGTTLHRIVDAGIDTGPILAISRQPARMDRSYLANVLGLYRDGCNATLAAIDSIASGIEPACLEQSRESGAYFSVPTSSDLARFHARDLCLATGSELEFLDAHTPPAG
jgi:methionyl-tRNA formyltransferase